ncbi:hypothetical protein [Agarilytica rhodophyticola]|uniref:hypothetical protein n=1 Tax=Agarilytica rhodophyticola TaxID=1737490 RepID=UPI00131A45B6|nr:hypothetical protein [Agarilytica rhodophyticola]
MSGVGRSRKIPPGWLSGSGSSKRSSKKSMSTAPTGPLFFGGGGLGNLIAPKGISSRLFKPKRPKRTEEQERARVHERFKQLDELAGHKGGRPPIPVSKRMGDPRYDLSSASESSHSSSRRSSKKRTLSTAASHPHTSSSKSRGKYSHGRRTQSTAPSRPNTPTPRWI